jgi:hypothetical protein
MKTIVRAAITLLLAMTLIACGTTYRASDFSRSDINFTIDNWPKRPQAAVALLIQKYGQPAEMTNSMIIWNTNGQWRQTIVHRVEIPHNFPMSHTDFLKQTINYRVPADKYDELASFDGSITADRTTGTISATCDKEEFNFLALNLAHDLVHEKISVEDARKKQARLVTLFHQNESDPYLERLQFNLSANSTADSDVTMNM